MMTSAQFQIKLDDGRKDGFRKWMQQPMTRALISTIPPCENLEVILEACYEGGFINGSAITALSFLETVMKGPPR